MQRRPEEVVEVQFRFEDYALDIERRELRRGAQQIAVEPQVFDLLVYLVQNRERVVTKDDLLDAIWSGRFVSESNLTTRINAARKVIGDSGEEQRLIRSSTQRLSIRRRCECRGRERDKGGACPHRYDANTVAPPGQTVDCRAAIRKFER